MRLVLKHYSGGVAAVFAPRTFMDTAALTTDQAASNSSKEGKDSKSMIEEQMSKYGDWAGKVLPSELNIIMLGISDAADLESSPELAGLSKALQYAALLSKYILRMSMGLLNYKSLEKAKDHIISSGAAEEIALTSEGYVFVRKDGDISLVPYTKFNPKTDIPLTNAELTNLRANDPRFGFNDKVTSSLMGATSMKEIREVISLTTAKLGYMDNGGERFLNPFSELNESLIGVLRDINITLSDLKTMDLGTLIKQKVKDKNNAQALTHAISSVMAQLTLQQKALLAIRAKEIGAEADPRVLVMEYMQSMANGEHSESLDVLNTFSSGNAELRAKSAEERQIKKEQRAQAAKAKEEAEKLTKNPLADEKTSGALRFAVGMGEKKYIEVTNGAKGKFTVLATLGDVTKNDNPINITTLGGLAESDFKGSLDLNNATVGGKKIEPYKRDHVLVDGEISKAALPIDQAAARNGIIKPDIDACQRMDYAWKKLKEMGIDANSILAAQTPDQKRQIAETINKVFLDVQLPAIFVGLDTNGYPITNITNYKEFAMLNGYVDSNVLPSGGKWEQELLPVSEEESKEVVNKFKSFYEKGKYEPPYKYDWWDPRGWLSNPPDLYEGTIFIPMKEDLNAIIATTGPSYLPKVGQALSLERRQYLNNKTSLYNASDMNQKISY